MTHTSASEEKDTKARKPAETTEPLAPGTEPPSEAAALHGLQQQVGNRAVQRLLAQRARGESAFDLDEQTTGRINAARGGGQALDAGMQARMGEATGHDFSGVRVHTGPEADTLNQSLSAKAFTTGQDIFFREGAYDPGSTGGQELIAHELTHVAQQSAGLVGGGSAGQMHVGAPGDAHEQQADQVAKAVTTGPASASGGAPAASVQREAAPEDEQAQRQAAAPEEEEAQRQAMPEDEQAQRQAEEEENPGG
mgnify:CR=1 FL=1